MRDRVWAIKQPRPTAADATICIVTQPLTPQQDQAIELLLAGTSPSSVAEDLGIHRTTLWRWLHEVPEFAAELNYHRRELWSASIEHLRSLVPAALDVLESELSGPRRLAAAASILDRAGFREGAKAHVDVRPTGATTPEGIQRGRDESRAFEKLWETGSVVDLSERS